MKRGFIYEICVFFFGLVICTTEPNAPVIISQFKNSHDIPLFRGKIREDETTVHLEPRLLAYDNDTVGAVGLICRYEIVSNVKNIPFVIELKDQETREAVVKLKEGKKLNYGKRKHYKFHIYAYNCTSPSNTKRSNQAVVTIKVEDVERFQPVFEKTTYNVDMEENKLYESIIKIKAVGRDRSPENSGICGYEVESDDAPFIIDKEGNLKNTAVVNRSETLNFILKVVARDCGGLISSPAYINVQIKETCKNGWRDFPEHIEYMPHSGPQRLTEKAHLQICDNTCKPDHISVKLQLVTKHISKGCDRDTNSVASQRKLCGASNKSIDLLPTSNWTNSNPANNGNEGDKIYAFDGITNIVEVPNYVDHKLHQHFTISTWMKHLASAAVRNVTNHKNGNKEHILCMSDGDGKNRQHYSLFIHNFKLIFLLRRESEATEDQEVFKPAEFRWTLDEVNDGQWHHYAISMDFPQIHLYVDGKLVESTGNKFEILDDWPLHPADTVHYTKLVVGACWRGFDEKFIDHFHGYLADLLLLKDTTESERVIQCLNNCQENLDFATLENMPSGMSVSFNSDMTEFNIIGKNATDVDTLVRELVYTNNRSIPTPGHRNIHIRTSVQCGTSKHILPLVESYIYVHKSNKPIIMVSGQNVITATQSQLLAGITVFDGIHVDFMEPDTKLNEDDDIDDKDKDEEEIDDNETTDLKQTKHDSKLGSGTIKGLLYWSDALFSEESLAKKGNSHKILLDKCTVRAEPMLNTAVEHLDLPTNVIKDFKMKLEILETPAGLTIFNANTIENYRTVIQQIHYMHTKAYNFQMKKFFISCSSQRGRFVSKEFQVTVTLPTDMVTIVPVHIQNNAMHHSVIHPEFHKHFQASTNVGMIAIIVVCVGFLLFLVVLGVLRFRSHQNQRHILVDEKQEMEWDNSELNITVNPIEQELFEYEENPKTAMLQEDSDTDDDVSEIFNDENDSSEDEMKEKHIKNLEWDDSTLLY